MTPSHPDKQKIRIIGFFFFFFENRQYRKFEVRLLLLTVPSASNPFDHNLFEVLEATTLHCT